MNNNETESEAAVDVEILHDHAELSEGTGSFYRDMVAGFLSAGSARCDCVACRERPLHRVLV